MHRVNGLALALVLALGLAGCTARGAGTSNFDLKPSSIGWYAGDEARFTLTLSSSLLHGKPTFVIDPDFAIEEIQIDEHGLKFGGDYSTKDPSAVGLRLAQGDSTNATNYTLDATHPSVDVSRHAAHEPPRLRVPARAEALRRGLGQVGRVPRGPPQLKEPTKSRKARSP